MIGSFRFENEGRSYACRVAGTASAKKDVWWWFEVSGDANSYAPFQASATDTQESVRTRVVAFYANLLYRRSLPAVSRWGRRADPVAQPAEVSAEAK